MRVPVLCIAILLALPTATLAQTYSTTGKVGRADNNGDINGDISGTVLKRHQSRQWQDRQRVLSCRKNRKGNYSCR